MTKSPAQDNAFVGGYAVRPIYPLAYVTDEETPVSAATCLV
jgi:hypothetical protein